MYINRNVGPLQKARQFELKRLNGLELWLKADPSDLTITSDPKVDAWTDRAQGLVFSQATASLKPESGNKWFSRNGVLFDGLDDILKRVGVPPLSGTKGYAAMVLRIPTSVPASNGNVLACGNSAISTAYWAPLRYNYNAPNTFFGIAARSGATVISISGSTPIVANTTYFVEVESNDLAWSMKVNGVAQTLSVNTGSNNGWWFDDIPNLNNMTIGDLDIAGSAANSRPLLFESCIVGGYVPTEGEKIAIRALVASEYDIAF